MGFDWVPAKKNYKRHYVCLSCQKGFKRPSKQEMKESVSEDFSRLMEEYYESETTKDIIKFIEKVYQQIEVNCPNCQVKMIQVHYNFEVPSKSDSKAWKDIRKRFLNKLSIDFSTYISWHKLRLQELENGSPEFKKVGQNLKRLELKNASQKKS